MKYAHVGINCTRLDQSVDFYTRLFGVDPVKTKDDSTRNLA